MDFPIKGSQVFTHKAPANYSTVGLNSSSPHRSSGLSSQAKLAIGIAIPIILFLILCSLLLFWYFKIHLPDNKPHHSRFEEERSVFQLYERQSEKGVTPPLPPPESPRHYHNNTNNYNHLTIYHPTPTLQQQHHTTTRYAPPHFRLHKPTTPRLNQQQEQGPNQSPDHPRTKSKPKPNIKIETGPIIAAAPTVRTNSPPPRRFSKKIPTPLLSSTPSVAIGTQLKKKGEEEKKGNAKPKFRVWLGMHGKPGKKRKGGKGDAKGLEDLFG